MKNFISLFLIITTFSSVAQTKYYVSISGNSTNNGTSTASTWSFAKINSSMGVLQAGDSVFFRRGDTFRGKLVITTTNATLTNKITFGAYGTGPKPIIKGSNVVSGWVASGQANLWYAPYSQSAIHLFKNNKLLTVARYPNIGCLNVSATGNTTTFTDNTLSRPADYFKDATAHFRSIDWQWEKRVVSTNTSGGQISYAPASAYTIKTGWGYYFDNKFSFLDAPNEWFYEAATNRIYVFSATNPSLDLYEAPAFNHGIDLEWQRNNVVIKDFDVRQQTSIGIYVRKSTGCKITNNRVSQSLNVGILTFDGSNNNELSYNLVEDILSTGVSWDGFNEIITNNTVRRIGLIPGYGTTGYGDNGMNTGKSSYVAFNVIDSIANLGLGINQNSIGEKNIVNCPCLVMNDCGGLTVPFGPDGGTNIILRNNIVTNVRGGTFAAPPTNPPIANGIYYGGKDNDNVTSYRNTVANCNGLGISMLDTKNSIARNNTIYNCETGIANIELEAPTYLTNNNTITKNIIYGLSDNQLLLEFKNLLNPSMPNNYNISDSNYLHNPYSDMIFRTQRLVNSGFPAIHYTLARMQAERTHDLNSKISFLKLSGFKSAQATTSNLITNGNFDANINNWGMNQNFFSISNWDAGRAGMSGGSLRFANNANQYTQPLSSFAIANNVSSQWYRLKFSIIGNTPNIIILSISNNNSPWNGFTEDKRFAINTQVSQHEYYFQLPAGAINARAGFRIEDENGAIYTNWLDNVALEAVTVGADIAPQLRSPLFINPTNNTVVVPLGGKTYRDLDGNYICNNSITLAPFTSRILIFEDSADNVLVYNSASLPSQILPNVNNCKWYIFNNTNLRLASVNPQANSLQTVTLQTYTNTGIGTIDGRKTLNRNWALSSSGAINTPVKVRLYFTQAEFDALNSASTLINSVNDLVIRTYAGANQDGSWANNTSGIKTQILPIFVPYQNGFYAEFSVSGFSEFWVSEPGTLLSNNPLMLSSICTNKQVQLKWQSSRLKISTGFEVQKSANGIDFSYLGSVLIDPDQDQNITQNYSFIDKKNTNKTAYYRLKILYSDNEPNYSNIILINNCSTLADGLQISTHKNNAQNLVLDVASDQQIRNANMRIISAHGAIIQNTQFFIDSGSNTVLINGLSLKPGMYVVIITKNNKQAHTKFIW